MDYKKIYYQIISKARQREQTRDGDVYVENHHIEPRSLGGSDESSNLVFLTAREHFLCHYLLTKMYEKETFEWYKVNLAFQIMKSSSVIMDRYFNSRLYEALKGSFSSVMRFMQAGSKNSQYGKMWISNPDLKKNKSIKKTEEIPEGWLKGRDVWLRLGREEEGKKRQEEREKKSKQKSEDLYNQFRRSGCKSLNEFSKIVGYSHVALLERFRKHIPDYKTRSKRGIPFRFLPPAL